MTTELCPTMTFDGEPPYRSDRAPEAEEIAERRRLYFDPNHAALGDEIARLLRTFNRVALVDAHSIRSRIPRLFNGQLPVFNLGTNSGASCHPELRRTLGAVLAAAKESTVIDGRFKGGRITRAYGKPGQGVEALQLELARADRRKARLLDARDAQPRFGGDPCMDRQRKDVRDARKRPAP